MKIPVILVLIANACFGQSPDTSKYSLRNVIQMVKKDKQGTNGIIHNINQEYKGEEAQLELVRFYCEAYDYKVVDHEVLKHVIDSLAEKGLTENVRRTASETRHSVENRFLNKKIKDFEFADRNGNLIKLSSLNDKIVIIELWATWCGPCIREMSKIPTLRAGNPNVEFYSISLDKSADKMKKFVEKNKYDWPIVFGGFEDTNPELWQYLNIVAVPKYYTVDRNGIVINVSGKLDAEYVSGLK